MKYSSLPFALFLFAILSVCGFGCGKSGGSGNTPTPTKPVAKTTVQLLENGPWKISSVFFTNATTNIPWPVNIPDSLKNLVLTLNTDGTFTETGTKTAAGTWTYVTTPTKILTLTTTSGTASKIPWTFGVSDTQLGLGNVFIQTTYVNPANTLQAYVGENIYFIH